MITWIPFAVFIVFLSLMGVFSFLDYRKKREITKKYFISFIVPCYNCKETIKDTIKSIFDSYEKDNFELFVINDNSTDDSIELINKLSHEHKFNIIDNKNNLGKAKSINNIFEKTKGEIIFIVDADTIITKKAVDDIISRLNYDSEIGAVSCPYKARGKGFLPLMQSIEYNILNFTWFSHNIYSSITLWGGCLALRKEAFKIAGKFSENALIEDTDLALKLNENKWRVEQSSIAVQSGVPQNFKSWYRQKMRWNGGSVQSFLSHPKVYLTNPVSVCLLTCYIIILGFLLINMLNIIYFYYNLANVLIYMVSYTGIGFFNAVVYLSNSFKKEFAITTVYQASFLIFNIPFTLNLIKKSKDIIKILGVIPFSLIYGPLYIITFILGSFKGIKTYLNLKNTQRAW